MDGGVKGEPNTAVILQVLSQTREETPRPAERIDKGLYEGIFFPSCCGAPCCLHDHVTVTRGQIEGMEQDLISHQSIKMCHLHT